MQRTEAYVDDDKLEVVAPATVKHGSPHLRDAAEEFGVDCYAILLLLLQLQMLVCFAGLQATMFVAGQVCSL